MLPAYQRKGESNFSPFLWIHTPLKLCGLRPRIRFARYPVPDTRYYIIGPISYNVQKGLLGPVIFDIIGLFLCSGRIAQLVRALPSHGRGRRFESSCAHHEPFALCAQVHGEPDMIFKRMFHALYRRNEAPYHCLGIGQATTGTGPKTTRRGKASA